MHNFVFVIKCESSIDNHATYFWLPKKFASLSSSVNGPYVLQQLENSLQLYWKKQRKIAHLYWTKNAAWKWESVQAKEIWVTKLDDFVSKNAKIKH